MFAGKNPICVLITRRVRLNHLKRSELVALVSLILFFPAPNLRKRIYSIKFVFLILLSSFAKEATNTGVHTKKLVTICTWRTKRRHLFLWLASHPLNNRIFFFAMQDGAYLGKWVSCSPFLCVWKMLS